jgi:ubiquinone/menaquinone biosynthesis C-methylase UbiE
MGPTEPVPFDRVAEVYDESRRLTPGASSATTALLRSELARRQPCLEIGVGTGLIALPLAASGIDVVGVDLSAPMLAKVVEKGGGHLPFPLVIGDATRLPFSDEAFGGAFVRHVLHLISDWRSAVAELVRVVASGGVLLINSGFDQGPWKEIGDHMDAQVGKEVRRAGLDFKQKAELDQAMAEFGASVRELPPVWQESERTLAGYFGDVEAKVFSWTWRVDPDRLATAVAETKRWASERFGDHDRVLEPRFPSFWHAYDLP